MIFNIRCWFGHEPNRKKITWDGDRYTGHCCNCKMPIRRIRRGVWKIIKKEAGKR